MSEKILNMEKEKKYITGFNTGYFLSKYELGLVNKFLQNLPLSGDFFQGFFAGRREVELENMREQHNHLRCLRNSGKEISRER